MRVLVTGGAGYVGSVSAEWLLEAGHHVTVLDSLVTGHRDLVPEEAELVVGSVGDASLVTGLLSDRGIEAVLHCAARSLVGESMAEPELYHRENVVAGGTLLLAMNEAGVDRLVYSSTAAVYGVPETSPIQEDAPTSPINPYGRTKLAFEGLMHDGASTGLRGISLRYFNVAGASPMRGERHDPETHLIPNLLAAYRGGPPLTVYGTDYPTPDGTAIRDYIHVVDLADAHLTALELTRSRDPGFEAFNLGSGTGFSVLEVMAAAQAVVGTEVPHELGQRRSGDPPVLVASNERAMDELSWWPARGTLEEMIGSAWDLVRPR